VFAAMLPPDQRQRLFSAGDRTPATDDAVIALPDARSLRIAACFVHPRNGPAQDSLAAVLDDFAREAAGGKPVRHVHLAELPEVVRNADTILYAEAATIHAAALRGEPPALSSITRGVVVPGSTLPAPWYVRAMQA